MGYQLKITKDEALIISYALHTYWYHRSDLIFSYKRYYNNQKIPLVSAVKDLQEKLLLFSDDRRTTFFDLDHAREKALVRIAKRWRKKNPIELKL